MIDASKYPKAAALQKLREEREEARLKALKSAVSIKPRGRRAHDACEAGQQKLAAKRKGKKC